MVYHGDTIAYQGELWCTGGNHGVPRGYYSVPGGTMVYHGDNIVYHGELRFTTGIL